MNLSLEHMVDFITTHGLTTNQFLLCYSLYVDKIEKRNEQAGSTSLTAKLSYVSQEITGEGLWSLQDIRKLEAKGFLIDKNFSGQVYTGKLEVTAVFSDDFFINDDLFEEFFEAYPFATMIDGKSATLKGGIAKEELKSIYQSKITLDEHETVVAAVKWGANSGLINMRIDRFLINEMYKDVIKAMRKVFGDGDLTHLPTDRGLDDHLVL